MPKEKNKIKNRSIVFDKETIKRIKELQKKCIKIKDDGKSKEKG